MKVQLKACHKPIGTVVELQPALKIDGATFSATKYKIKWDNPNDGKSGWLNKNELKFLS